MHKVWSFWEGVGGCQPVHKTQALGTHGAHTLVFLYINSVAIEKDLPKSLLMKVKEETEKSWPKTQHSEN